MDATVNARVTPIISGKNPQTDLAPGNALVAGMRLREFEIVETLGEGGFSIVYGARDLQLMREVAIKEYIPISLAGRVASTTVRIRSEHNRETFEAGLNGFINEARLLAQFKHPGLVEVLQFWEENGTAYMVMPRYTGKTLRSVLKEKGGQCDEPWLRGIVAPVLDVLELLHSRNVFHRDIAPDNILIKNDGTPVLLDLGSAREVVTGLQKAITVVVKPGYAPIEQYSSDFALPQGPWTDVYAVGALLHFAILGCPPPASISRIMKDSLQPLAAVGHGGYSREFLTAIDRALALQPGDRPQSIAELRELLRVTKQDKTVIDLRPVFAAVAPPMPVPVPVVAAPEITALAELDPNVPGSEDERTVIVSAQEVAALVQQLAGAKAAAAAAAIPATTASAAAVPAAAVSATAPPAAVPAAAMPDATPVMPTANASPATSVAVPELPPIAPAPVVPTPTPSAASANAQTFIGELPVMPPPPVPSIVPAAAASAADVSAVVEFSVVSHAAPIVAPDSAPTTAVITATAATAATTPAVQEIESAAAALVAPAPTAAAASDEARNFLSLSGVELTLEPMDRVEPEAEAVSVPPAAVAEWRIEAVSAPPPRAAASAADSEATLVMPAPAQIVEAARATAASKPAATINDSTVVLPAPDALALARSVAAAAPAPVAANANEPTVVLPAPVSLARPAPSPAELDPLAHAPKRENPASNSFPEMEDLLSGRLATESRPVAVPVIRTPAKTEPAAAPPPPVAVRPWLLPVVGGGVLMILVAVLAAYLLSDEMPATPPPLVAEAPKE
ncbi:MAG TPA: serine/threonine-protein kinase, partial [Tahibacter sp.]|nr:serine/threonine-protein kinase [Tahibacter sp.]